VVGLLVAGKQLVAGIPLFGVKRELQGSRSQELQRLPSLDGPRAISIVLVLYGHSSGTLGFPIAHDPFGLARVGVQTFFVISGFLVTELILAEIASRGTISLSGFYRRRVLRIFPALYAYWCRRNPLEHHRS
jgi:peptidoglycan/LPS O-acetylase OafA/YrhL